MSKTHKTSVRVRMYRQGLGDCFLLTFSGKGKDDFNILVDCGVLQKTPNDKAIMTAVVQHIASDLPVKNQNKKWLDVVVLTHEHADHISGFTKAKEIFAGIEFGEVWASWLDDETHPKYKLVRERFHKQVNGLQAALTQMTSPKTQCVKAAVELVLNEFFEDSLLGAAGAGGRSPSWDFALKKSIKDPQFFVPGKMFSLPGFEDVRIYILGPSEDYETFTQVNPTAEDTYRTKGTSFALVESFLAAVAPNESMMSETFQPFERRVRVEPATAANGEFFKSHYGFDPRSADSWRRIDDDWLSVAGGIALNLDSYTNNTCLAFAIEFTGSKKVMLFPGDAQFSNWLSWQDLSWEVSDGNGSQQKMTTKDLFERTIFYKVGHHGSHNATLKKHGLEMMTNPELMAMIPVDREMAKNQKSQSNPNGWEMPEKNLFARLNEKTRGRIIIADEADDHELKVRCKDKAFLKGVRFVGTFVRDSSVNNQGEPVAVEFTLEN